MSTSSNGQLKQHLTQGSTWWRLPLMILFGILFHIAAWVAAVIVLFQFLHTLFTGAPNPKLHGFSAGLGNYLAQITHYVTYHSEVKPFPIGDWPAATAARPPAGSAPTRPADGPPAAQPPEQPSPPPSPQGSNPGG